MDPLFTNLLAIFALVNVATSAVLGTLVFLSGAEKRISRLFALFACSIVIWSITYYFWQLAGTASTAMLWLHLLMAGAIFIPFVYLHFIVTFLNKWRELRFLVFELYGFAGIYSIINWMPGLFIGPLFAFHGFSFWPTAGPWFTPFLIVWGGTVLYIILLLLRARTESSDQVRHRIDLILFATIIGYGGGATNFFLWYGIPVLPYANVGVSFYIALVAYSIVRYRMFDMRVVAAQSLTFFLWLLLFIRMLLATTKSDQIFNGVILAITLIAGAFLIRSVDKEVEQRERLEKLTKDLENANTRLTDLDRQKSEFIGIAAHQLRSPIAAIKGYSSLILEGSYGKPTKRMHEVLQIIFDSSDRMADTIVDFLNVSRIEQGRMEYNKKPMDLAKTIEETVETFQLSAKEKHLALSYADETGGADHTIFADPGKIQHVINNLIDNAIKYTPEGSITVKLSSGAAAHTIRASVTDTGAGIPQDAIGGLFVKFVRARNAKNINVSGTGLGLYVARQMIEAHGGKIWAESAGEGKGSTFAFELPLGSEE